jgi:hypothetical protein
MCQVLITAVAPQKTRGAPAWDAGAGIPVAGKGQHAPKRTRHPMTGMGQVGSPNGTDAGGCFRGSALSPMPFQVLLHAVGADRPPDY